MLIERNKILKAIIENWQVGFQLREIYYTINDTLIIRGRVNDAVFKFEDDTSFRAWNQDILLELKEKGIELMTFNEDITKLLERGIIKEVI